MGSWLVAIAVVLGLSHAAWAEPLPAAGSRVRSTSPRLSELMAKAVAGSPTFRGLVEAIDASDGIVYVEEGTCGHGVRACLKAVSAAGGYRVLRVQVQARAFDERLAATIGHELRHALEVLAIPAITSTAAMQSFYLRDGSRRPGGAIETDAALEAGDAVRAELREERAE